MEVVHERCAGLAVQQKMSVACALTPAVGRADGQPQPVLERVGTMTAARVALARWLAERGGIQVAMESTGVSWPPVWHLLEEHGGFARLLVNAHPLKAGPGRKTDSQAAQWRAERLRHGLVRGSVVPERAQREVRELTR